MKNPQSPQVSKLQARVAIWAGVFIVVLMSGSWFYVAKAVSENHVASNPNDARFLGQVFTAFALIIIAGFIGIANGMAQLRSGKRSVGLTIAMYVVFLVALGTVTIAVNGHHS